MGEKRIDRDLERVVAFQSGNLGLCSVPIPQAFYTAINPYFSMIFLSFLSPFDEVTRAPSTSETGGGLCKCPRVPLIRSHDFPFAAVVHCSLD